MIVIGADTHKQTHTVAAVFAGTGQSRRGERTAGKSDPIDALAVARAVLREGPETLPAAHLDEDAMQLKLLLDHREDLVKAPHFFHRTEISLLEHGRRLARIDTVVKLGGGLGVEPCVLLDGIVWHVAGTRPGSFNVVGPGERIRRVGR